jgi:cytochrome c553
VRASAAIAAFVTACALATAHAEAPQPRWSWTAGAEDCLGCHEAWVPGRSHDLLVNTPELRRFSPEPGALPVEAVVSEWELWIDREPSSRETATCGSCHQTNDHPAQAAASPPSSQSVRVESRARCVGDRLVVDVEVAALDSGHSAPGRAWPSALLLRVDVLGADGLPLALVHGEAFAGRPGRLYARVLLDAFARPLWARSSLDRAADVLFDTRLDAGRVDAPRWVFAAPGCTPEALRVSASVIAGGASRRSDD